MGFIIINNIMKRRVESIWTIILRNKHYFAMILIQFVYAGTALFSKAAITKGMNPYIFVVYRQAFASLALAPFAYFIERADSHKLSVSLLGNIFMTSLGGITLSLNLYYIALHYVSATFATAFTNIGPAITFILAVCFRIEKLSLKEKHGLVKLLGTAIGLSGALIFTFVKGPPMYPSFQNDNLHQSAKTYSKSDWLKGSFILLLSNAAWASWLILQRPIVKKYPAKLRLTTLQCLFSSVQSAIWALVHEREMNSWKLEWNVNLVSVIYCGVIVTGISYWLLVWVVEKKGPVFPSLFNPLSLIVTAGFSAIFFKEILHWGSFCGGILLVGGLYGILCGKKMEENMKCEGTSEIKMKESRASEQKPNDKEEGTTLKCITSLK